jgi:putative ABC transport system permease protein
MDSLVLSNIAHRPARTAVSIAGIAIGVLLVVFTVGLAHGMLRERGQRESNMGAEIMLRAPGTIGLAGSQGVALRVSHAEEVARIPGVRRVVPIGQSLDKSDSGLSGSRLIDGIEFDQYAEISGLTILNGRKLEGANEAIADAAWMREHPEIQVGSTIRIFETPFRMVGVYGPPGGAHLKIPLSTMQELRISESHCTALLVVCDDPSQQEEVAARISRQFDDQILLTRDLPAIYVTGLPALNIFLKVVVGVASVISMLVILLAMYTTVTERTRQIGVLKALGMSKSNIAWVIEQEALLVSVLGVATGVILAAIVRFGVMRLTTLIVDIEPKWVTISLVVGLIGGSIGALYPALRAARQDPVDALSYE